MAALIRGGMLCRSCTRGKCRNISTDQEPIGIECPDCEGEGCEHCTDGEFRIEGCPNSFCSSIVTTLDVIDMWSKGMPPIDGGVLDQSASFVRAVHWFEAEERKVRNDRSS